MSFDVWILVIGSPAEDYKKNSMGRWRTHTLEIDFLGEFDFPESNSSCWKSLSFRREAETERARTVTVEEDFLDPVSTF